MGAARAEPRNPSGSGIVRAVSIDLGRRLIAAGLVSPEEVEAALFLAVARGLPFPRVLIDRGAISERGLEAELERVGGLGLRQVDGAPEVVKRLPRAMCRRLAALPTRVDPATGTIDVAAADPLDAHVGAEFGFHLGAPIRVPARARERRMTPPFPHGAPQSTIPPPIVSPVADEAPIPLVRKIPHATDELPRSGGTLVPPSGAPPIAIPLGTPRPPSAIAGARATPEPDPSPAAVMPLQVSRAVAEWKAQQAPGLRDRERERERERDRDRARDDEPPSVSFPSIPPREHRTPPYGSPVYDASAPPLEPNDAGPVYRIAPPADEAFRVREPRRADAEIEPAVPPPNASTNGASASPHDAADPNARPAPARRPSRPTLAPVPYPAPAPPAPPPPDDDDEALPEPPKRHRARAPDAAPVMDALRHASSRDEVIRLAMRGMRLTARRIAVFAVRKDGFHGWACNVELGDEEALRGLHLPPEIPSVLATATATAIYLGPIPATPAHEGLLAVMERSSPDVAAVAVRVAGRAVLVLLCDDLVDTMVSTRFLGELARAVGEALARLIAR
jgi:hypothetical protein